MIKKILKWVLLSSKDPRAVSLTVKGLIVGVIPYLMQANDVVCQFGHQCITLNSSFMEALTDTTAALVYYVLSVVAVVWTIYGLVRKINLTIKGENKAV